MQLERGSSGSATARHASHLGWVYRLLGCAAHSGGANPPRQRATPPRAPDPENCKLGRERGKLSFVNQNRVRKIRNGTTEAVATRPLERSRKAKERKESKEEERMERVVERARLAARTDPATVLAKDPAARWLHIRYRTGACQGPDQASCWEQGET